MIASERKAAMFHPRHRLATADRRPAPDKGWKSLELFARQVLPRSKDEPVKWRKTEGLAG
jgi:hypothetical protein